MKVLKRLLPIFVIIVAISGYLVYSGQVPSSRLPSYSNHSVRGGSQLSQTTSVLGSTTKSISTKIRDYYQTVADDQEQALINSMVETIKKQLVGIPESQSEKIKYQFCQEFISDSELEVE